MVTRPRSEDPHDLASAPPGGEGTAGPGERTTERKRKPLLSGPVRTALTLVLAGVCLFNVYFIVRSTRPKLPPDQGVHLRAEGGGVPVYASANSDERIYWLPAGTVVLLGDARRTDPRPRRLVYAPIEDGMVVMGYVDAGDLVAQDVDRVRTRLLEQENPQ
jgi:hypothetical protein